MKIELRVS
jgi:hypothetical protein